MALLFPSFEKLASLFNFQYYRVSNYNLLNDTFDNLLDSNKAVLFDIVMDPEQIYLPRLSTSKLKDGTLTSPPIEDLDPIISANILGKLLGQKLHPNSLKVREK